MEGGSWPATARLPAVVQLALQALVRTERARAREAARALLRDSRPIGHPDLGKQG